MLFDDVVDHRQAQSRAFAYGLGSKEGVKYLLNIFFGDTDAVVGDPDRYGLIFRCVLGRNGDSASLFLGLLLDSPFGIADDIKDHLLQELVIALNLGQVRFKL